MKKTSRELRNQIAEQEKNLLELKKNLRETIRKEKNQEFQKAFDKQGNVRFKPLDIVQFIDKYGELQEREVYEVHQEQNILVVSQKVYASIVDVRENSVKVPLSECLKVGEKEPPEVIDRSGVGTETTFFKPYLFIEPSK